MKAMPWRHLQAACAGPRLGTVHSGECCREKGARDVFVQAQVEDTSKPKVEYGKKK